MIGRWKSCVWAAFVSAFTACADPTTELKLPTPDARQFEQQVYPVLLRDCGFSACHGDPARFFRVFGPGRRRYRPETGLFVPPTGEEIRLSYERARSMLASEDGLDHSDLLRKPLHADHGGVDEWGHNTYRYDTDPGYAAIYKWAHSASGSTP